MGRVTGSIRLAKGKRGDVWYAHYRLPSGRQVQKRLGRAWQESGRPPTGYYTKRLAEAALRSLLVDAERGVTPDPVRTERGGRTFEDAVTLWLAAKESGDRPVKNSTLRDYRCAARSVIEPAIGAQTPLDAVTREALEAYKQARLSVVSRRTVQKEMVILSGVLDCARKAGWIQANPAADLDKISVRASGEFNVLDARQVQAVADAAKTRQDRAVILTAAFAALRLGEIRALRWCDIRFDLGAIQVNANYVAGVATTPKSGKVRSVPLMDAVADALRELRQREHFTSDDDLCFPSVTGGYMDGKAINRAFYAALTAAGLGHLRNGPNPFRWHDLRHSAATLMVQAFPLSDVQRMLGHADIQTTMIYAHSIPQHDDAARLSQLVAARPLHVTNGGVSDPFGATESTETTPDSP
jgi:integrase